jgi:hypothetical protein
MSAANAAFITPVPCSRGGQEARLFELSAKASISRPKGKHGYRDEARARLAEIYNWFTEGFDTADLKDAKALLEELSN